MIDLDRLPAEPSCHYSDKVTYSAPTLATIEALSVHKIPFHTVSCERDGMYKCPICKAYSMKLVINYRCEAKLCNSRIIKYKKFDTEEPVSHPYYDTYIKRFYEDVERRKNGLAKNKGDARNKKKSYK
jgi:hypothetical protein